MSLRKDLLFELERTDAKERLAAIKAKLATPKSVEGQFIESPERRMAALGARMVVRPEPIEADTERQRARALRGIDPNAIDDTFLDGPGRIPEE
jgi:hypothetical protein